MEKVKAQNYFDDALERDMAAIMASIDENATDSFIIQLGHIGADCKVKVEFEYFMDLKLEDQARTRHVRPTETSQIMKLHIPMTHKKRFVPQEKNVPEHNQFENNYVATFVTRVYITCNPEPKKIFGKITDMNGKTRDRVIKDHAPSKMNPLKKWVLDHEEMKTSPEDIELYIDASHGKEFSLGNVTDTFECNPNNKEAIYVTHIRPNIVDPKQLSECRKERKEYCFIVDRSGSMSGSLMRQAKECLLSLIQQLPSNCSFNICSFGSRHRLLWEYNGSYVAKEYTEDNIAEAKQHIESMEANFGGTELKIPLEG